MDVTINVFTLRVINSPVVFIHLLIAVDRSDLDSTSDMVFPSALILVTVE